MTHALIAHLPAQDRAIVGKWLDGLKDDGPAVRNAIARNIAHSIHQHRRAEHHAIAIGFVTSRILRGDTVEEINSSWHGSGGYLISIGVFHGIMDHPGKPKAYELGIRIRGKGLKIFNLRKIYTEAKDLLAARARGQKSLFAR